MCVIIACYKTFPSLDTLTQCETANPDGGGLAYIEQNQVKWYKGLSAKKIYSMRNKGDYPKVIHFRIATVGGKLDELCHPFPITADAQLTTAGTANQVIAHNGHYLEWEDRLWQGILAQKLTLPDGKWSDTRALAWLAYHFGNSILSLSNELIAHLNGNKQLTLYGTGWKKEKDIWFSNVLWKHATKPTLYYEDNYSSKDLGYGLTKQQQKEYYRRLREDINADIPRNGR